MFIAGRYHADDATTAVWEIVSYKALVRLISELSIRITTGTPSLLHRLLLLVEGENERQTAHRFLHWGIIGMDAND